jgi:hypothetical protein
MKPTDRTETFVNNQTSQKSVDLSLRYFGTSEARYAWFNNYGALSQEEVEDVDWALWNARGISLYSI